MLAELALVAILHGEASHPIVATSDVTTSRVVTYSRHERHELHELHIRIVHRRHELHMAESGALRTPVSTDPGAGSWKPGVYSCHALESLWIAAGGNRGSAFLAAEIAVAESGGISWAISPTDDYGLWQINASNGALATLDPFGNARSAVILSRDGASWYPWTTYVLGLYAGRC